MGLWGKSVVIFNSIREHGKQSIRSWGIAPGYPKAAYIAIFRQWIAETATQNHHCGR